MSTKLTEEELGKINAIGQQEADIVLKIGQSEIQLDAIKKQKEVLLQQLTDLGKERTNLMNDMQAKYGEGTIDINTGEFTSHK
tara:strand:+ start:228 stop:476 length:249 start_codon:yes stop_codon:yes gene_type:complete